MLTTKTTVTNVTIFNLRSGICRLSFGSTVALLLIAGFSGCASMTLPEALAGFSPVSKSEQSAESVDVVAESRGSYEILMKPKHGQGSKASMPMTGTVLVQDAIEASNAVKKYKSMQVTIYRPVKGSPVPLQMQADYDATKDAVLPEQNYEVLPGDQVLIEEASSAMVGKMLDGLKAFER